VQRQDAAGNPITSGTTTVDLTSSSGGGHFYQRYWLFTWVYFEVSSVTIDNTQSTADFWYRDYTSGTPTLTASDEDGFYTSATTIFTINGNSEPFFDDSITPTSVTQGSTVNYTYTITRDDGSSHVNLGYATIQVPAGFTGITVTLARTENGEYWSYSVSGDTITVHADNDGEELDGWDDYVQVVFNATAPALTGTYTFTTTVYENYDGSGAGPGTNTGTAPAVTVYANLFSDNFAGDTWPSAWYSFSGSYERNYDDSSSHRTTARLGGSQSGTIILRVDKNHYTGITISYDRRGDGLQDSGGDDEHFYISWSTDGTNWNQIEDYTSNNWGTQTYSNLAAADSAQYLYLRFYVQYEYDGGSDRDRGLIDSLTITASGYTP
jgi:hypothetical protein